MTSIRLISPHSHAGVRYDPPAEGVELEVSAQDAEFLHALGKTTPLAAAPPPLPEPADETSDD